MRIPRLFLCAALAAALTIPLSAQQAPTGYYQGYCVKVNPGQWANAEAWIMGAGHKFAQAGVDAGAIASAFSLRAVMPRGVAAPCDYLYIVFYKGMPTPDMPPAELTEALQKSGIAMTAEQYNAKLGELFTLVNNDISQIQTLVGSAKNGDYLVVNTIPASDVESCMAYEKKVWQPLADQMVKDGKLDAWAANEPIFPAGTKDLPSMSTVDVYPSYEAFTNSAANIWEAWKTVHPDLDIYQALDKFGKLCPREHTVLYKVVEQTAPAK